MSAEPALFEVTTNDGHVYRIYADGRTEGFPKDILIVNRFHMLANELAMKSTESV